MSIATISCPALDTITAAFSRSPSLRQAVVYRDTKKASSGTPVSALDAQKTPSVSAIHPSAVSALPAHVLAVPYTTGTRREPQIGCSKQKRRKPHQRSANRDVPGACIILSGMPVCRPREDPQPTVSTPLAITRRSSRRLAYA